MRRRRDYHTLQVFWLQPRVFRNPLKRDWTQFRRVVPRPRKIRETFFLKLNMGTGLERLRLPADPQKGFIHPACFTARPVAHEKRIDFGGFLTCSVRSAMTRKANAVTSTSASSFVFP